MKNPGNLGPNGENWEGWEQNILIEDVAAPDVLFDMTIFTDPQGNEYDSLVAGELWSKRVMIYYVALDAPGGWSNPDNIRNVIVDPEPGMPFQASPFDLDKDGILEILASGFLGDTQDSGNLWLYRQPEDFRTPNWPRESISSGYTVRGEGNLQSPGRFREFYPST